MTATAADTTTADGLLVVAALRSEYAALAGRLPGAQLERCGMGPAAVERWLQEHPDVLPGGAHTPTAVAVAGVAGGLDPSLRPGDVVVASEVRGVHGRVTLRAGGPLVAQLRRLGLRVRHGPILSQDHVVGGPDERERLAAKGLLAADMESEALVRAYTGHADAGHDVPIAVVRVIVDTATVPLLRVATVRNGVKALGTLRRLAPALQTWAGLAGPREVVLAGPRSFCAGVERAIDIVDAALQRFSHPVYVRRQIVHNAHVVRDLEQRGAVFVEELDEVPDGATVVFSAHGVAPAVRDEAAQRGLNVIDATCPLVAKVHTEARRFAGRGDTVLLIGHDGHDETEGTLGEVPGRIQLVRSPADVDRVQAPDPGKVSYLMQTTLAVDDAADTVAALRERFPLIESSATDDICYATTNRQVAVRAIADESDVVIVLGSANSSNSLRLVEVAQRAGVPAHLADDATALQPEWLTGRGRIGLTAGASAPPHLVDEVVGTLQAFGSVRVTERVHTTEEITFTLPKGVSQ